MKRTSNRSRSQTDLVLFTRMLEKAAVKFRRKESEVYITLRMGHIVFLFGRETGRLHGIEVI